MPTLRQSQQHQDAAPQGRKRRAASSSSDEPVNPPFKKQKAPSSSDKPVNPQQKSPSSSFSDKPVNPPHQKQKTPSSPSKPVNPSSKKQKAPPPRPPRFWDGLLKVPLCRSSLQELDRRNGCRCENSIQTASIYTHHLPPNLGRFARQGGPDLLHLRGYQFTTRPYEMMAFQQRLGDEGATNAEKGTKPTGSSIYCRAFEQMLNENGIFPHCSMLPDGNRPPRPNNSDEIERVLTQPRQLEFNEDDFRQFRTQIEYSPRRERILTIVVPLLEGRGENPQWRASGVEFSNIKPLIEDLKDTPNPDLYHGSTLELLDPRVLKKLDRYIRPLYKPDKPVVPNFFFQAMGCSTPPAERRQVCHYSAHGARAIRALQSYSESSLDHDYNASTLMVVYQYSILKIYATYATPPKTPDGNPGFVTNEIMSCSLGGTFRGFCEAITAYRNARDWAKAQRDHFIQQANLAAEKECIPSPVTGAALLLNMKFPHNQVVP